MLLYLYGNLEIGVYVLSEAGNFIFLFDKIVSLFFWKKEPNKI